MANNIRLRRKRRFTVCYFFAVSAVLIIGCGGRIGGHIMPRVPLPVATPKRRGWNKGRIIGQKRPLLPKQVWAIRARLKLTGYPRDLALFNVAIDRKLRGCDLVKLAVSDLIKNNCVRDTRFSDPKQNQATSSVRIDREHA